MRIHELMNESGLYSSKELEFFADLIIVRCIMACTANLADPRDTPELRCATRIREYFYESQN